MEKSTKNRFDWGEFFLLLLITGIFTLVNYLMVTRFNYFPRAEASDHLIRSLQSFEYLKTGHLSQFFWGDEFYPPLLYQTTSLFFLLFPPGIASATLSQSLYWGILIFSLYGIGKLVFSRAAGLLAVFFFLTAPLTLIWSYQYMLDIPAASMFALCFYFLLKSDDFTSPLYSRLFGLGLGLGMLLKWWVGYLLLGVILYYFIRIYLQYVKNFFWRVSGLLLTSGLLYAYYLGAANFPNNPLPGNPAFFWEFFEICVLGALAVWGLLAGFFTIARRFAAVNPQNRKSQINFLAALAIALLTCGWLYFNPNFALLNGKLFDLAAFNSAIPWPGTGYYSEKLLTCVLRLGYFPFLIIGLGCFFTQDKFTPREKILLLAFLSATLLLVLVTNKDPRYLTPWLILAAPLAVYRIARLTKFRFLVLSALLLVGGLYLSAEWLVPSSIYRKNLALNFLAYGSPSLLSRTETKLTPQFFRSFFAPLPKKGEKVLFFSCQEYPPVDIFRCYPLLYRQNFSIVKQGSSGGLNNFHYLVYARKRSESLDKLLERIKLNPVFFDADCYNYQTLSSYFPPGTDYELRLAEIRRNPRIPDRGKLLKFLLSPLKGRTGKIYLLDPEKKLGWTAPLLSGFNFQPGPYPELKQYQYLIVLLEMKDKADRIYQLLKQDGRFPEYDNFTYLILNSTFLARENRLLCLARINARARQSNHIFSRVKESRAKILLLAAREKELDFLLPLLKQNYLDYREYAKLQEYQYLVYLASPWEKSPKLYRRLKLDDRFADADKFDYRVVMVKKVNEYSELRLCRIVKKSK